MNKKTKNDALINLFKALGDANRLKIVGLLAQDDYTVEELAEILQLRASTVSHHLSKLSEVGLVSARAESYYNIYRLESGVMETLAQQLLAGDLPRTPVDVDLDAYDRKVVQNYSLQDGRLKTIPSQRKKREAILRHVVKAFHHDEMYSEKEVNEILAKFHEDTATLRRELIGYQLMARESDGKAYWRLSQKEKSRSDS